MRMTNPEPVQTPPTLSDVHGKAWRIDLDVVRTQQGLTLEDDCALDCWIVEAPWAHLLWHSYAIILVHLRLTPDNRPTEFYLDGATHEMWVEALDPRHPREPAIKGDPKSIARLTPLNFAAQFIEISDELARERIERDVKDIIAGKLSPDTDHMLAWIARYNDRMLKK